MRWKDIQNLIKKELNESNNIKEAEVTADNTKFNLRTGVNKNPTKLGIKIQFEPKGGMLPTDTKSKLEVALQEKLNVALAEYDIQVSKDTDVPRVEVIGFFIPLSQLKNLIVKSLTGKKVETPKVPAPAPASVVSKPITPKKLDEAHGLDKGDVNILKNFLKNHLSKDKDPEVYKVLQFVIDSNVEVDQTKDLSKSADDMINEQLLKEALKVKELNEISGVIMKEDFYGFINAGQNILRTLDENNIQKGKKYLEYLVKHNII